MILPHVLLQLNLAFELVRQRGRLARGGSRCGACEQRRKQRGREVHLLPDVRGFVDVLTNFKKSRTVHKKATSCNKEKNNVRHDR